MKKVLLIFCLSISVKSFSQTSYEDSLKTFLKAYVQNHEVVKGNDKEKLDFYEVNKAYRVIAHFKPSQKSDWLSFKTSGTKTKVFKLYGTLSFTLNNQSCQLNVYQPQELINNEAYKNYLFLPFTDATTGDETYISGRYLDLATTEIKNGETTLDFNKAYNPYCAYVSGVYNCPIPPKENALTVAIKAGEKNIKSRH